MLVTRTQNILIVDDDQINVAMLTAMLAAHYQVLVAGSGAEALVLLSAAEHRVDLILLDVQLPDQSGYQLCKVLKTQRETSNIPVIFITARDSVEDEAYGLSIGAVDYITKPYSASIVLARVKNHLKLKLKTDLLEELVAIDGLTDIANRRFFDEALQKEWRRMQRVGKPISVMMLDIDFFKAFNDKLGHTAGDECLRKVAQRLQKQLQRSSDTVARFGGEEFAVIISDSPESAAALVAERLRVAIEQLGIIHPQSATSSVVTVSVGVCTALPNEAMQAQQVLEQADKNLYLAKQQGRNQVVASRLEA